MGEAAAEVYPRDPRHFSILMYPMNDDILSSLKSYFAAA